MSNFLAIATVTATLQSLLQEAAEAVDLGADAIVGRPEASENGGEQPAVINLYMFMASPNVAWRNADLPTRRSDSTLVQRPQVALDLHYLLTFRGDETNMVPERLLGSAASRLHAEPVLSRARIQATIDAAVASDPMHFLGRSDLTEQIESVRFTPLSLNLEELSKLWSVFFQIPYALSAAYQASVVLIEKDETPQSALPVRARNLYVKTFRQPLIEKAFNEDGEDLPLFTTSTLLLQGQRLRGDVTVIRVGSVESAPVASDILANKIRLPVPAGVRAGVQSVQVLHRLMMGTPPTEHAGFESNAAPIVLRPVIAVNNASAAEIELGFTPAVGKSQRVILLLNEFNAPSTRAPFAYTFNAPKDNGITAPNVDETATITFPIAGVAAGDYLVRVQVDGAESVLTIEENEASPNFNRYIAPLATIP